MKTLIRRSNKKGKKTHGFRTRSKTRGGRKVLANRRRKVKKRLGFRGKRR
ncbi:MAG: 50S ribosomal protein L34 [Planctomycetota bacterium]